ncbi:GNAT family N-acetyltransferase [Acinetobacter sp. YH12140]|uniref:GNAT family N-acetyltransferase n=1 Tax=Acinetobacter sp. YH12140 TaxID=2601124 RepID=UPI0015D1A50B|nr:GNAT family N-acetyltransferase [Acinetobacter sp. YH12140]
MGTVTVRPTVESDWEILKNLRLEALQDSPDAFTATYEKTKTHSEFEWRDRAAQKIPCQFLLAFDGIRAVGMAGGIIDEQHEFNVVAMWVHENYRGKGVADLLISHLKKYAANQGYTKIVLRVELGNLRAIQFYSKQGFIKVLEQSSLKSGLELSSQKMECLQFF